MDLALAYKKIYSRYIIWLKINNILNEHLALCIKIVADVEGQNRTPVGCRVTAQAWRGWWDKNSSMVQKWDSLPFDPDYILQWAPHQSYSVPNGETWQNKKTQTWCLVAQYFNSNALLPVTIGFKFFNDSCQNIYIFNQIYLEYLH